ncbi:MAG: ankyrin repeat domain-containing protein [Planctomycetota bacterium]
MSLFQLLDQVFDETAFRAALDGGADLEAIEPATGERPLHTAVRRRRLEAVAELLRRGAEVDAPNRHGKTAWVHAVRRGFTEVADLLSRLGATPELTPADRLAVALTVGDLDAARQLLRDHPGCARTGNPEEDRLLADLAGRPACEPVALLLAAGADLAARGLDGGAALHQAAWFGAVGNARQLVAAGAPLDDFDNDHRASPLHWAVHGSRHSGAADRRQDAYVAIVELLLDAGSAREYPPGVPATRSYRERMLADASPRVLEVLRARGV